MTYPGGKGGSGVWQTIINQIPPHRFYFEPFIGAGSVMFHKRRAEFDVGADLNGDALRYCLHCFANRSVTLKHGNSMPMLELITSELATPPIADLQYAPGRRKRKKRQKGYSGSCHRG